MRRVALAWALLMASGAAYAQANGPPQQEEGVEPQPPAKKRARPAADLKVTLDTVYDDNIINLKDADRHEFLDGTRPDKYRIRSIDDFILIFDAEVSARVAVFEERPSTELGLEAELNLYSSNSIANYEQYRLWAAQDVGDEDRLKLAVEFLPEEYDRELRDPVTSEFSSAFRTEWEQRLEWRHKFTGEGSVEPFIGLRSLDYNSSFGFRDLDGWLLGARGTVRLSDPVDLQLTYEFARMNASADGLEPDYSQRQHVLEPAISVRPAPQWKAALSWRLLVRDYTTGSDVEQQGREDVRQRWKLEAAHEMSRQWRVHGEFRYTAARSSRPSDAATADETDFTRWVLLFGVTLNY